jgi:diphthamide biosynthesis protein 2
MSEEIAIVEPDSEQASILTSAPALSTPADHIFDYTPTAVAPRSKDVSGVYEIAWTAKLIRDDGYKKVALQFPDDMLSDSSAVYVELKKELEKLSWQAGLYILGDTSYSPCCVDLIAASHVDADCVVHYGNACFTPLREGSQVRPIYIYTNHLVDLEGASKALLSLSTDKILVVADMTMQWAVPDLVTQMKKEGMQIVGTEIIEDPQARIPNRRPLSDLDLKDYTLFHIGEPNPSLLLMLNSRVKEVKIFVSGSTTDTTVASRRSLKRRYAALLSTASASIIGILIASPSSPLLPVVDALVRLIKDRRKKSYVFAMGKLNAAKLANFAEVEAWVCVGCWNSSLVDARELGVDKAIITPWELTIALEGDGRIWGENWETDLQSLFNNRDVLEDIDDGESKPPQFDFRTGRYVSNTMDSVPNLEQNATSDLVLRPADNAVSKRDPLSVAKVNNVASPGAQFLNANRTWTGLGSDFSKIEIGYEESTEVEEGRSGIARGYAVGDSEKK